MRARAILVSLAVMCCAMTARAMDGSDEHAALIGTWALESIYEENDSGEDMDRWGDTPTGQFIVDTSGHFMFQLVARDVISLGISLHACDAKAYQGIAYAGRLEIDPKRRGIVLTIDAALSDAFDHSRRTASMTLTNDRLDLISSAEMSPTGVFYSHIRWKRVH